MGPGIPLILNSGSYGTMGSQNWLFLSLRKEQNYLFNVPATRPNEMLFVLGRYQNIVQIRDLIVLLGAK